MKRFALPLGLIAFALACTDATSPDPHAALSPKDPTLVVGSGNIPPPPVDAAINVTISGAGTSAALGVTSTAPVFVTSGAFNGTYFSNGASLDAASASIDLADPSLGFLGTAWLRFDNKQPDGSGTTASANARVQRSDDKFFGRGTLVFNNGLFVVTIDRVTAFGSDPSCNASGVLCATIMFDATVNGTPGFTGTAEAFNRAFCTFFTGEGNSFYSCGD